MFTLIRTLPLQRLLVEQLPTIASAWVIAELFYKFHSFSLETAGFLATWFVLDALIQGLRRLLHLPRAQRGTLDAAQHGDVR